MVFGLSTAEVIGIGAVVGAGATVYASNQASSAAKKAAAAQKASTNAAIAEQKREFDQEQANLQPYLDVGKQNLTTLNNMMQNGEFTQTPFSYNMSDYTNSDAYKWQLNQAEQAIANSQAAKGGYFSGNTGTALENYAVGLADQNYQQGYENAYNTWLANQNNLQTKYNEYANLAGIGQSATSQLNSLGSNYANNLTNLTTSEGTNLANLYLGEGANQSSMYTNLGNTLESSLGSYLNYQNNQQWLNYLNS